MSSNMPLPINVSDLLHGRAGRATGIPKILRVMRQNGSPPPEFEFDEEHSYFQVRLRVHPQVAAHVAPHVTPHVAPHVSPKAEAHEPTTPTTVEQLSTAAEHDDAHEPMIESLPPFSTSSVPVQYQSQYQSLESRTLALLESGARPISAISRHLGQSRVSGQLKVVMKRLLDQDMVEHTLPDKPRSRLQQYRLTAAGRAWLAAQQDHEEAK